MRNLVPALALSSCVVTAQNVRASGQQVPDTVAYDVVISGARVFDGTGNPGFYGDVVISAMRELVRQGMRDGAWGLSAGLRSEVRGEVGLALSLWLLAWVFRPSVLGVTGAQLRAHFAVGALPEALQVLGHLYGPLVRREQV